MSLYSDEDNSTSFRSLERTQADGEGLFSHRGNGMACCSLYQSTKTWKLEFYHFYEIENNKNSKKRRYNDIFNHLENIRAEILNTTV